MKTHPGRIAQLSLICLSLSVGCASKVLQYDRAESALKNIEYEDKIQIKQVTPPPSPTVHEFVEPTTADASTKGKNLANEAGKEKAKDSTKEPAKDSAKNSAKNKSGLNKKKEAAKVDKKGPRQPDIEDSVGFDGRRPIQDPFRVGEKVTLDITYFNIVAGTLEIMVKPTVEVNGQKAYHFEVHAETNSFFNRIYGVNDTAITYLSYDEMKPLNLSITLKESKQLAEARTFVDWKTLKASYWQKRVTEEKGEQSKKIEWSVLPYSQNVISAIYYLRTFTYREEKPLAFRVADEGKNIVFTGELLRREKIQTAMGELDTIVLKPKVTVDGVFAPVGEILFWLTDDDRKFIVRIESKIKIGTLVAKLRSLDKGHD